jgi:hypothetical protein
LDLTASVLSINTIISSILSLTGQIAASGFLVAGAGGAAKFNQSGAYTQLTDNNGTGRILLATTAGDSGNAYFDMGNTATASHIFRSAAGAAVLMQLYSRGTLDLKQTRLLSIRTLAASSLTASAANTNLQPNEIVFTVGGASGASLAIYSGGTVYIFNSIASAAAA